ncbi:alpha/beta hydrolase [Rhodococcus sp. IEGM 1379]|uniref:alpha/beta fold hydrolase n=1 Tax=Rhodococcus sp. IEGM 1379 TaxID=3047086 RepID=UPI0024B7095D|nr:alpha/beta hydrolase [Rhodococcus sp. IEGM 1379]MDI9916440.1 alpha/beta hydrolase [Rhodococcus sp. IEGM 1379]
MALTQSPTVAVVLPGTGSDAHFAERAFRDPLDARSVLTVAIEPDPRRVVDSYLEAMDAAAAEYGPILVGGVSIGAAVALQWAACNPTLTSGVLAALPAWTGAPDGAPAAASARFTASQLRSEGLESVIAAMLASSPAWLGRELERSWRSQWPDLPCALDEASTYSGLTVAAMSKIGVPVGIASAVDDPVHPSAIAHEWAATLPHAHVGTLTLEQIGQDPSILGSTCVKALAAIETDTTASA